MNRGESKKQYAEGNSWVQLSAQKQGWSRAQGCTSGTEVTSAKQALKVGGLVQPQLRPCC
jgi:hypothetical protein